MYHRIGNITLLEYTLATIGAYEVYFTRTQERYCYRKKLYHPVYTGYCIVEG